MRVKFGSFVTEGQGSLGGHTIQRSNYGSQLRSKPVPKRSPSFSQSFIRSIIPIIQQGWKDLTSDQRKLWLNANVNGITGHSLWMQLQFTRLHEGLPFLYYPSNALPTYLGDELVDQATWADVGLPWWSVVNTGWSGNNSYMYFSGSGSDVRRFDFFSIGVMYKIAVKCAFKGFRFIPPWDGTGPSQTIYDSGNYVYFYVPDSTTSMFMYAQNCDLSIFSLSVKQVFNFFG